MESYLNQYKGILQKEGYKLTNQRRDILKAIVDNRNEHLSCEDVFGIVSVENPEIGIATVYRTLQLFERLNIVYKINFDDGLSRYELNFGTENHHHHHLICLKCGKVLEVQLDLLESLEEEIENNGHFKIVDHNVKFYGYCNDCIKEEEDKKSEG
ncbi:Fur family transcriptional regulator [Tissierella sp. Yu-01]|uniref:Fur family transcriptional regulator n=1 Tax=Tissierella sp. Yu-01 TaxID=3035694 RepID=UPI00240E2B91|nr:Fur family transcriptional regulator [Tissierella sp. Yu-01]WFA09663.1 Fur family transcriptional regulator [Tissierella sp. Yu-01]